MKILIIGGVAGGATSAARLRRLDEKAEIVLFERGEYISYANCGLPYYIGNRITDRDELLLQTPESFNARYRVDVRINTDVLKINAAEKSILVKDLFNGKEYLENYDKLIISTGAEPIRPPLKNINNERIFTLRNVADTDKIKSFIMDRRPQSAVVVGGGFIGLEMAENLHRLGLSVSVVEKAPQVMAPLDYPMAAIVHRHLQAKNVRLLTGVGVTGFEPEENGIRVLLDNDTELHAGMAVLSIGVRPDTRLAREAGLATGGAGGIQVDEFMQTSDRNIYALGDAVEVLNPVINKNVVVPLAGPANKQARIAADNIVLGNKHVYKGTMGTSIAKVFDLTVAATGVNSRILDREQISHVQSFTHSASHASYYPGAREMSIKINFDKLTGRLFGAQIVGGDGVDKRIDVFAEIIKSGGTIFDLQEFEHAYAPPYNSAKDAVNIAGFVAENIINNMVKIVHWDEIDTLDLQKTQIIDVRTREEFLEGNIENSINIPVDEIRENLSLISAEKKIILVCAIGLRGYVSARILMQSGFREVYNLSGGYTTYLYARKE